MSSTSSGSGLSIRLWPEKNTRTLLTADGKVVGTAGFTGCGAGSETTGFGIAAAGVLVGAIGIGGGAGTAGDTDAIGVPFVVAAGGGSGGAGEP